MRLYEEYLHRSGLRPLHARHQRKGFLYFNDGDLLLSLSWINSGNHPGYYDFCECKLDTKCRIIKSHRVDWDEYESWFISWLSTSRKIIFDKKKIFDLTWEYFLRRNEDSLIGSISLSEIYSTIDPHNPHRLLNRFELLDKMRDRNQAVADFWHSRALDIVSLYCHWVAELDS